jgi:hypothetical protein
MSGYYELTEWQRWWDCKVKAIWTYFFLVVRVWTWNDGNEAKCQDEHTDEFFTSMRGSLPAIAVHILHAYKNGFSDDVYLHVLSCLRQQRRSKWWFRPSIFETLQKHEYKVTPCSSNEKMRKHIFLQNWVCRLLGRAIAQAVSRWLPTAAVRGPSPGLIMWDLWWTKWRWGRFSLSTSVSPANLHSTNYSTIILICHLGFVQ